MTRRLAALTFAAVALTVALLAQPAAAHEGTATVDCDRAVFGAIGFGPGEHTVGAVLTVAADDVPTLADLAPQTFDGDAAELAWDVSEHTDRPGLLELDLAVSWDAHGGGTTSATALLVCSEPVTTTTTVPQSSTTTTTGVPVTAATTVPATTTTVVPPAADDVGPPELPRTGGTLVPLTVGALVVAVGALGLTLGRRGERAR